MVEYGYLERPYMVDPYLAGFVEAATLSQWTGRIFSSGLTSAEFISRIEGAISSAQSQFVANLGALSLTRGEFLSRIKASAITGMQVNAIASGKSGTSAEVTVLIGRREGISSQVIFRVETSKAARAQFIGRIEKAAALRTQYTGRPKTENNIGGSFYVSPHRHRASGGYLISPYMMGPYLGPEMSVHVGGQFVERIESTLSVRMQLNQLIATDARLRAQVNAIINQATKLRMQWTAQQSQTVRMQFLAMIYNTNLLRVLWQFPSRGLTGFNWTVIAGGQRTGDFGINNVNSDIVEECYRSTGTSVTIQSDTGVPQGIFNNTLGILNHNLTSSANVAMQASNDVTFSSVPYTETIRATEQNIYWVAESLPTKSYRYWRFVINDPTNPQGFIQLGTVVFGSATIFNGEAFVDQVQRRQTHFADRIKTAGFSNVSNDRALKRAVSLTFSKLQYNRENYSNIMEVFEYVRTSLKALWLPAPQYGSRFAVFGKLSEIPSETHEVWGKTADYVSFDIDIDEAL
jgi:hypothetical protein